MKARMEVALVGRVVDSVLVGPARARMDLNGLDYISAVACVHECQIYMAVSVEAETRMYQNAKLLGKLPSSFLLVRVAPFLIPFPFSSFRSRILTPGIRDTNPGPSIVSIQHLSNWNLSRLSERDSSWLSLISELIHKFIELSSSFRCEPGFIRERPLHSIAEEAMSHES
jgi:hypothetical protein